MSAETTIGNATINKTTVSLVKGDLTNLDGEAFVFYAEHDLKIGSGFGTAITQRGGQSIQKEVEQHAPLDTTEAVVTEAGKLKAAYVIHAVGPRFLEEDLEGKLHRTMLNTLKAAEEKGIRKVAFPPMGAGFYGVPLPTCASVMMASIKEYLAGNNTGFEELIVCCMDNREADAFQGALASLKQS